MNQKKIKEFAEALIPFIMPYIENKVKDEFLSLSSPQTNDSFLLTKNQVISKYQISAMTLWRLEQNGELIPVRVGRKVMYKPKDVEKIFK